jgi:hypothetical protein
MLVFSGELRREKIGAELLRVESLGTPGFAGGRRGKSAVAE